jgi:hypothetical protein
MAYDRFQLRSKSGSIFLFENNLNWYLSWAVIFQIYKLNAKVSFYSVTEEYSESEQN